LTPLSVIDLLFTNIGVGFHAKLVLEFPENGWLQFA
jgi:hypothetical protein